MTSNSHPLQNAFEVKSQHEALSQEAVLCKAPRTQEAGTALTIVQHDDFAQLGDAWDALAQRVRAAPWMRPGWLVAWWRAFGRGALSIFTAWRGSELVGVLPLRRRFGEFFSLTNCHTPSFSVLAEDRSVACALLHAVFAAGQRRVTLSFLSPEDVTLQPDWPAGVAQRVFRRTLLRGPYVPLVSSWPEYKTQLGGKFLGEIRRRRRLLQAQGQLVLQIEDGKERLDELLAEGFRIEASGWKGSAGSAIIAHPHTHQFYREVAHWGAKHDVLRLAFLRLNGRTLAFDYCLEDHGIHYLLKTGYDPAYGKLGPGILLRYEMLARAFASNGLSYEFLGVDAPWKRRWTDKCREQVSIQAFPPSLSGLLEWSVLAYGRSLAKNIIGKVRSL